MSRQSLQTIFSPMQALQGSIQNFRLPKRAIPQKIERQDLATFFTPMTVINGINYKYNNYLFLANYLIIKEEKFVLSSSNYSAVTVSVSSRHHKRKKKLIDLFADVGEAEVTIYTC